MLNNFLPGDQLQAQREIDCFEYCSNLADSHFERGQYAEAAAYYDNATRSLRELKRMQEDKQHHDNFSLILEQIKARQHQDFLLIRLRSVL